MAVHLIQEADGPDGGGLSGAEEVLQIGEGQAGIDDILHQHHMTAGDIGIQVLDQLDNAGGLGTRAVAGHGNKVHIDVALHLTAQIDVEEGRALEDTDHNGLLVLVLGGQLHAQGFHPGRDLLLREENLGNVVFGRGNSHESYLPFTD